MASVDALDLEHSTIYKVRISEWAGLWRRWRWQLYCREAALSHLQLCDGWSRTEAGAKRAAARALRRDRFTRYPPEKAAYELDGQTLLEQVASNREKS